MALVASRRSGAAVLAVLALAAAGCGASRRSSTASSLTTASTPIPPGRTATAPPPTPRGTPGPPDGLRATTGYGTYELCSGHCAGSVPDSLRRPLHLPKLAPGVSCPTSVAGGPLGANPATSLTVTPFVGSAWSGGRITWTASAAYGGPVLIRGRQLGGPHAVGFGEGHVPYDELQLLAPATGAPTPAGGGRAWPSFTRVRTPGCYAYQVDGTSFSEVIVFQAGG